MKVHQQVLEVRTSGPGFSNISRDVQDVVSRSGVSTGLCTAFVQHCESRPWAERLIGYTNFQDGMIDS